jgi:hypothetical protein
MRLGCCGSDGSDRGRHLQHCTDGAVLSTRTCGVATAHADGPRMRFDEALE